MAKNKGSQGNRKRAKELFLKTIDTIEQRRYEEGKVGKLVGQEWIVDVPGQPGMVYVRLIRGEGSTIIVALNRGNPVKGNDEVVVKKNLRTGRWVIDSPVEVIDADSSAPLYAVPPHTHKIGSGREYMIETQRIEPGLVYPDSSGCSVKIKPFFYRYDDTMKYYAGGTFSLTSYRPATTGHYCWVVVGIDDAAGTIVAEAGPSQSISVDLPNSEIENVDFPYIPLAAMKLRNGQTSPPTVGQIRDLRSWVGMTVDPVASFDPHSPGPIGDVTPDELNGTKLELIATNPTVDFKTALAEDADVRLRMDTNGLQVWTGGNGTLVLAMTIDSSQNTTFTGIVQATQLRVLANPTSGSAELRLGYNRSLDGVSSISLYTNGSAGTTRTAGLDRATGTNGTLSMINLGSGAMIFDAASGLYTFDEGGTVNTVTIETPATSGDALLKIGDGSVSTGAAEIKFISSTAHVASESAYIKRAAGTNGGLTIHNSGTGDIAIDSDGGLILSTGGAIVSLELGAQIVYFGLGFSDSTIEMIANDGGTNKLLIGDGSVATNTGQIYFISSSSHSGSYSARMERDSGTNGVFTISSKGTGGIVINAENAGQLLLYTSNTLRITVASTAPTITFGTGTDNATINLSAANAGNAILNIGTGDVATNNSFIQFKASSTHSASYSTLVWRAAGDNGSFAIENKGTGNITINQEGAGTLIFKTTNDTRMTIDASGNITYAGASTLTHTLTGTNGSLLTFKIGDGAVAAQSSQIIFIASSSHAASQSAIIARTTGTNGNFQLYNYGDGPMQLGTQGSGAVFLVQGGSAALSLSSGPTINFGTGSGSPTLAILPGNGGTATLTIGYNGVASDTAILQFITSNAHAAGYGFRITRAPNENGTTTIEHRGTQDLNIVTANAARMVFYTNNTYRMLLGTAGGLTMNTWIEAAGGIILYNPTFSADMFGKSSSYFQPYFQNSLGMGMMITSAVASSTGQVSITNAVKTSVFSAVQGTQTIKANGWAVGKRFKISVHGNVTFTGAGEVLLWDVLQGVTVLASAQSTATTAGGSYPFTLEVIILCISTGATNNIYLMHTIHCHAVSAANFTQLISATLTSDWAIDLKLAFNADVGANTIVVHHAYIAQEY